MGRWEAEAAAAHPEEEAAYSEAAGADVRGVLAAAAVRAAMVAMAVSLHVSPPAGEEAAAARFCQA
jgi:hypothetical protein